MKTIGFAGAGNMACALGGGILASAGAEFEVLASDPSEAARVRFADETGGRTTDDLAGLAAVSDVLVLAVKPQIMPVVLGDLARHLRADTIVVSIAAGVTLATLVEALGSETRLVRAMPNTPALVRRGMTVLVRGGGAEASDLNLVEELLAGVGRVLSVEDESLLDAVTAVSGSGPGFVFAYGEAMVEAAVAAGLPVAMATILVQETLAGAAELWRSSGEEAASLRRQVTSKGGTTAAGLEALAAAGFAASIRAAVEAATQRSRDLSAD
jgi:pyrroline-5-carboxylate reductase